MLTLKFIRVFTVVLTTCPLFGMFFFFFTLRFFFLLCVISFQMNKSIKSEGHSNLDE